MYFVLSGEGPTDLGSCDKPLDFCEGDDFLPGPMAIMVDQIVEARDCYSPLEYQCVGYVSEKSLTTKASELRPPKKSPRLAGAKRSKMTLYFFSNARALARIAVEQEKSRGERVVAVLFRDSDRVDSGSGTWEKKRQSVIDGFKEEKFDDRGVAMIPRPKSEAWLLCALKSNNPYQYCEQLEDRSGSDRSPNSLKNQLEMELGGKATREQLVDLVRTRKVNIDRIQIPSFVQFRNDLQKAVS